MIIGMLMGMVLAFVFSVVLAAAVSHLTKVDKAQKEKFKEELENLREVDPEVVAVLDKVLRPKPADGRCCPQHNWVYDQNQLLLCSWCNQRPGYEGRTNDN